MLNTNAAQNIPVFLSSDDNYAPFIATAIASVCNNTKSFIEFYIFDCGITPENKNKIKSLKEKFGNFSIEFIKIDTEKYFKDFNITSYLTPATYCRFLMAEIFPDIKKALYLDADIILKGDIKELFNIDLEDYAIGAAVDQGNKQFIKKLKTNIGLDLYSNYFNAGVLLIDIKKWQKDNIAKALFEIEKQYRDKLLCNDQDILNKYFENNYKILDSKYNSMFEYKNTIIRHFTFKDKPWHFTPEICVQKLPEYTKFWNYAKMTPFYNSLAANCKYTTLARAQLYNLYKSKEKQPGKSKPEISVIIPVYNSAKHLRKCLDSIYYQTFNNIEIICIDDCSTDISLEILKEYARFDGKIKIISFKENKGVSAARNAGIEASSGKYISFVDPDDYIDLDFYEKLHNEARKSDADIVKGNRKKQDLNTQIKIEHLNSKIHKYNDNKFYFTHQFTTAIYKTNLIKENNILFPEDTNNMEDIVFLLHALIKAKSFKIIDNTFYNYIRHKNSLNTKIMNSDAITSFLNSTEKLCSLLNAAYLKEISKEDYIYLYSEYLSNIYNNFFRCSNIESKMLCCKKLNTLHKQCIEQEYTNEFLAKNLSGKELIETQNPEILFNKLNKYNSINEIIIQKIRKTIKKDMHHA